MLEGWLGHCLNKTASSRVGHVFQGRKVGTVVKSWFWCFGIVCFFLRVKRLQSRSDLLINRCRLLGHREWSPCSVITMPGGYYCSLLRRFDLLVWLACSYSTPFHLCQSPLILYRGHKLFPSPALPFCTTEATELSLMTLAINPTVLSCVTVSLLKKHTVPNAGHSEDLVVARSLGF